jgi:subtilase family serine protease
MGQRLACIGKTLAICLSFCVISVAFAQNARVTLSGHVRPAAIPANDQGRVDSSLFMRHVTLTLPPSDAKQTDLNALLDRLQDPASADYHRWLTPEQYGARFGASAADIARVTSWLGSQNLTVDSVGRGRTTIAFTGAVRDVENAFQIEIHNYRVSGEMHYANASEPSVPAALGGLLQSIRGLDDFRLKPIALKAARVQPSASYTSSITGLNYLGPNDMATIFDIAPVYNLGITGSGQKIAVVGQTDINLSDIEQFRSYFNLSANDPQLLLVPKTPDPGFSAIDLPEADLDIEWSGALARDATIVYVYSQHVYDALYYAIDQNSAPVITMSYGECEPLTGNATLTALRTYAQQAAAQGISWMAASGDDGANGCYTQASSRGPTGLAVDQPASIPEVTGLGGTTLAEATGNYWSLTNDGNHASALSYIPETAWNDTVSDGTPSSTTGGPSSFFAKPVWQTGSGVPNDGWRDVPDIAMPASADHDAYLVYTSGTMEAFGGTSVSSPVFAGITGLVNQYMTANGFQSAAGQGNMNPRLYALAST